MSERQREVDAFRRAQGERENHLIDEYSAGRISRREFVRRGTIMGLSIPVVGWLAAACGGSDEPSGTGASTTAPRGQGRRNVQIRSHDAELGPRTRSRSPTPGGLCLNGQTGEYLSYSLGKPELEPRIAESWEPNDDATVWTFKIRQGVTFNDEASRR